MAYKDDWPLVGANGDVYLAPDGTPIPDAIADLDAAPWAKVGLISEDGVTWTPPEEETEDIGAWQTPFPVRILTTSLTTSMGFGMLEWDRVTLPIALGGGTFDDTGTEFVVYKPPAAGLSVVRALFVKVLDTPRVAGIFFAHARVSEREDINFKRDEAAILNVTFGILGTSTDDPYNIVFNKSEFPTPSALSESLLSPESEEEQQSQQQPEAVSA